jgi:hypothetical protein
VQTKKVTCSKTLEIVVSRFMFVSPSFTEEYGKRAWPISRLWIYLKSKRGIPADFARKMGRTRIGGAFGF